MNCRSDIAEGLRLAARLFLLFFDKSRVIVLLSKQEGNTHLPDRMDLPQGTLDLLETRPEAWRKLTTTIGRVNEAN